MNAYRFDIVILDSEDVGMDEIYSLLRNAKYIHPSILKFQSADIGEWYDEHPLNHQDTKKSYCDKIFNNSSQYP